MKDQKAIDLLKGNISHLDMILDNTDFDPKNEIEKRLKNIRSSLDQALALLEKQPEATIISQPSEEDLKPTEREKRLLQELYDWQECSRTSCPNWPTGKARPDCPQPEGAEFVKDVRINFTTRFENPDWVIHKKLMEACNIIDRQAEEIKRLNELFERWQYMIDPDTNPGGCANCFHQEWKADQSLRK